MSTTIESWFDVKCHCGRVKGRFRSKKTTTTASNRIVALDCNCSDCGMRGNRNIVVAQEDFQLSIDKQTYEDSTILYQWGTLTAVRRFCKYCGILPWYNPRSKPDGIAVNLNCVDWGDDSLLKMCNQPDVVIKKFDGIHWEDSFAALKHDNS